jgi:hypothetical protein
MRRAIFAVFVMLAVARPARAELWASSMGDLMKSATRIEVIDVDAVDARGFDGRLAVAVRSTQKAGDRVHVDLILPLPPPAKGDRVLVVCDSECPRAIGVEHGGAFQLIAQEPMDGAFVNPNVVEEGSLAALAAGKPAPALCVRGDIQLLDDAARPSYELRVSAADGNGSATLAGRKLSARLGVVWFASEAGAVAIVLADKGAVSLVADHVTRAQDGCYQASLAPSEPLARTRKSLTRALDGTPAGAVIAKGTLAVAKGAPVAAGVHAIALSARSDGQLELASDLAEGQVSEIAFVPDHFGVGFPTKGGAPNDPELFLDLGVTMAQGLDHGAQVARALHDGAVAHAIWIQGTKRTAIGVVKLTYVQEP